jgi:hypothetical protein
VLGQYQERDYEIIDYELFSLPGTGFQIRGPAPTALERGEYFACVGAAQTFGCFCEKPYPTLLSERLHLAALNLGFAGAGPRFFVGEEALLTHVNQGRFVIVQVMSGRSEDNSLFDSGGREYLTRRHDGQKIGAEPAYRELLEKEVVERVESIVEETRANWVQSFSALLKAIEVPTILFWYSKRSPDYEQRYSDVYALFGEFPHLVNRAMVEQIKPLADAYVECISARGLPQRLVSRFTGEPASVMDRFDLGRAWQEFNTYYPSPEMHEDAADALLEACSRYSARGPGARSRVSEQRTP